MFPAISLKNSEDLLNLKNLKIECIIDEYYYIYIKLNQTRKMMILEGTMTPEE